MHWYGKHEVSEKRKVGHITIVASDNFQARQRLRCIDTAAAAALEATTTDAAATGLIYMPGGRHCISAPCDVHNPSIHSLTGPIYTPGAPSAPQVLKKMRSLWQCKFSLQTGLIYMSGVQMKFQCQVMPFPL